MTTQRTNWYECVAKLGGTRATFQTDGGAWPMNPGHGGLGVAVLSPDDRVVRLEWRYLGSPVTSNEAEYAAVWRALEIAKEMRLTRVDIRSDSQLVVKQLNGEWEVRSRKFQDANATFENWQRQFQGVTLEWIPREKNELANSLVEIVRRHDWGTAARPGVDGRDELGRFLVRMFERNDVHVLKFEGGYIHLEGCLVRPLPFYHREGGVTHPSTERTILEEARKAREKPVVFAWRPQGMHADAMTKQQVGKMPRQVALAEDNRVEPLFAFATDLKERVPEGQKKFGYRGSRVLILEGPWLTVHEFFWWRRVNI